MNVRWIYRLGVALISCALVAVGYARVTGNPSQLATPASGFDGEIQRNAMAMIEAGGRRSGTRPSATNPTGATPCSCTRRSQARNTAALGPASAPKPLSRLA